MQFHFDPPAPQGKCAFVNLGKKASELTVADVSGFWGFISSLTLCSGLGCARASQEPNGAHKGTKYPDLPVAIYKKIVMTSSNNAKVEEMWEAQFNEEATSTRREIDNLAPKAL